MVLQYRNAGTHKTLAENTDKRCIAAKRFGNHGPLRFRNTPQTAPQRILPSWGCSGRVATAAVGDAPPPGESVKSAFSRFFHRAKSARHWPSERQNAALMWIGTIIASACGQRIL
jgi:hypothetical protein